MKKEIYTCDKCGLTIDGKITPKTGGLRTAGGGELCTLSYSGLMGHNGFSSDKHYHYVCFSEIISQINAN